MSTPVSVSASSMPRGLERFGGNGILMVLYMILSLNDMTKVPIWPILFLFLSILFIHVYANKLFMLRLNVSP